MNDMNELIRLYNDVFTSRKKEHIDGIAELETIKQDIIDEYGIYVEIVHERKIDRYDEDETNRNGWSYYVLDMATHEDFSENLMVYLTYKEALLSGLIEALACIHLGWTKKDAEEYHLEVKPFQETETLKKKIECINKYFEHFFQEKVIDDYTLLSIKPLKNEQYELWYRIKIPFKTDAKDILVIAQSFVNDLDDYTCDEGHCVLEKLEGNTSDGYSLYLKI